MANKEKEEVKKKSTLVHDTICLFMITLISGLLLGAGYTITKKPIAAQEEKNKQEAYEAVYQGASFEEDSALNKSLEKFNKDLAAGKVSSKALGSLSDVEIAEAMKAKVDGKDAGYVVSCSGKGYGGAVSIALGIDEKGEIKWAFRLPIVLNETPGLGQKSSDKEFNGQFVGTNASQDLNVVNRWQWQYQRWYYQCDHQRNDHQLRQLQEPLMVHFSLFHH